MEEAFNIQNACAELKIGEDTYLRIMRRAFTQTDNDLEELKKAYQKEDLEGIQAISHRLKGDYANLRVERLAVIAKALSDLLKASYDHQKSGELIEDFSEHYLIVKDFVQKKL